MKQEFLFLAYKKGTSKTGSLYKMLELSSNHRNFTCRVADNFDEKDVSTMNEFDKVTLDFLVQPDYNGNASVLVTGAHKVKTG